MMYMPMNTGEFYNDLYAEVIGALSVFTVYAFVSIGNRIIADTSDVREIKV
jgi:hypothetical protein